MNELELLDWKRRVFELYAEVRTASDPADAWRHWRDVRDELFRTHPQSPLTLDVRGRFSHLEYFAYDSSLRVLADVEPAAAEVRQIAGSAGSSTAFRRFGHVRFELEGAPQELELLWLEAYGGGVFLPFGDATSGQETYGGGRYLLDTVKGSDLGEAGGRLVLDFNFAYNPSCSYDPRWACPLTPPANRLAIAVRGGERMPLT
ncbi:MAG: DUF1684 domain-containing protein [Gaiellaceae bacterium]